jgi:hypothetical protein
VVVVIEPACGRKAIKTRRVPTLYAFDLGVFRVAQTFKTEHATRHIIP